MESDELARKVATDLGSDVLAAVEKPTPPDGAERRFGLTEAMMIGSFITACANFAVQMWRARQDRALLMLALAEGLIGKPELASRLDPEQRLGLMARIVNALIPERFGSSPSIPVDKPVSKQEWLTNWKDESGRPMTRPIDKEKNRAMTQPILVPFADMDNWIVYKEIYWTAPAGAPSNLPDSVTVPRGFVTDLASIPPYFWWALPPIGRYGHAAILHDWLYWEQDKISSRAAADKVFEVAMAELNVAPALRKAMWAAVRVCGGEYWNEDKAEKRRGEKRVLKRLPDRPVSWADWKIQPDVFA